MSDRDSTCQWEISIDSTIWNKEETTINIFLISVQNMTIHIGTASSRSEVVSTQSYKDMNSRNAVRLQFSADKNVYIAAIPDIG